MGRYKEAPPGFACPYRDACPHLGGISSTWAKYRLDDARRDDFRDSHFARDAEAEIKALEADVERLEKENAELRARLQAQHRSRFKPNRLVREATPGDPPRKRGAPVGHPPWSRSVPGHIDQTVNVPAPRTCPHCQTGPLPRHAHIHEQIQEDIVLQPKTTVTRYLHETAFCPTCRRTVFQTAEGELRNCEIGPTTKATAVFLRHTLKLSYRDIRRIFRELFAMPFVPASALAFDHAAARAAESLHEQLRDKVRNADIIHGDETSWRIDGKSAQLWYAGTPAFGFFHIDPSRAGEVASSIYGSNFQGSLVADDYAGYNAIHPQNRQSCLAHLSRKAREILQLIALLPLPQQPAPAIAFCQNLRALFANACQLGRRRDSGQLGFREARARIPLLYQELHALCATPLPFPPAETLRQRLLDPKRDYHRLFTFLEINRMAPTNNHAEQALRWPVIFRKIVFGSRSARGAHAFSVNYSVLHTAQRQNRDPIPLLRSLLLNGPEHPASQIFHDSS
jgi:transposase